MTCLAIIISGHANRPDLARVHKLLEPEILVPMHGEHRQLRAHVKLGQAAGIASALTPNGTMVDLTGTKPEVVDYVETGRVYLDGTVKIGALDGVVRDRIRMALNGHVMISVILDEGEPLGEAWVEIIGLPETGSSKAPLTDVLEHDLTQFINRAGRKTLADDDALEKELRNIARRTAPARSPRLQW